MLKVGGGQGGQGDGAEGPGPLDGGGVGGGDDGNVRRQQAVPEGGADQVQAVEGDRQRVVGQLGDVQNALVFQQRMVRLADCHDLLPLVGVGGQGRIAGDVGADERNLRHMVQDVRDRKVTGNLIKVKVHIGVRRAKVIKQMMQEIGGVARRDRQLQEFGESCLFVVDFGVELFLGLADLAGVQVKDPPGIGQLQLVPVSDQQLGPVVGLHIFQLIAQGRLGDQQLVGRSQNASAFHDRHKVAVGLQGHRDNPPSNIIKILYKVCNNDSFIICKYMLQCKLFLKKLLIKDIIFIRITN